MNIKGHMDASVSGKLNGDVYLTSDNRDKQLKLVKYIFQVAPDETESSLEITAVSPDHNRTIELQGDPRHIINTLRFIADQISDAINS